MMPDQKTFEDALSELQTIIKELESGSPSLIKMTELFEDGMQLLTFCRNQLNKVEDRVTTLIKDNDKLIEESGIDET